MEITWLGHSCFRLKGKEVVVLTDPYDESIGHKLGKQTADIVAVTNEGGDHSNVGVVRGTPKVVRGPGEYEIRGVVIIGIQTYRDAREGKERGKNTVYVITMDGVTVCHLGDLGHIPSTSQVEEIGTVDALLVPVGGKSTINAAQAAEVVGLIEPRLIIPMHYKTEGVPLDLDPVDKFCREMGLKKFSPQPKLAISKSSLADEPQVVILEPRWT